MCETCGEKVEDIYIYLEPKWPLFLKVKPPKQGLFQSKQGSPLFFDSEQEQVYQKRTTKNVDIYQVGSENV